MNKIKRKRYQFQYSKETDLDENLNEISESSNNINNKG